MPWEASTDFGGVRPPGFPGSIPVDGGFGVAGWISPQVAGSTSTTARLWSRLPWEPSNLSEDATEIRDQAGWGFAAYGDECADQPKKYATREIFGTASRLVATGGCSGQIDDQRVATDWVETWEWSFETTEDDPETEEVDESFYEVVLTAESEGTFQRTTNSWTPSGGTCIFVPGTPVDVDPPAPTTEIDGLSASWAYPAVSGFTPSGSMTYTLSDEVTTATMAILLDEWLAEDDAFRAATAGGLAIYQTESPDATYGVVARGKVRFPLKGDIPSGFKAVVDYVLREAYPVDRLSGQTADVYWHDGEGSLTLSEVVTTSADALGEWPRGDIGTEDVDAAPWELAIAGSVVGAASNGDDGDCGLAVRVVSLDPERRFRVLGRMNWTSDSGSDEAEFLLTMAEEEGEPTRTAAVYWSDHAPAAVRVVDFRIETEPGDIEEWDGEAWVTLSEAEIEGAMLAMSLQYKARGGGPWGFRNFDPAIGDPATPAWYATASVDLDWQITGTNPEPCGDTPSGELVFLGEVTVDAAGRYSETITTDTAVFGGRDFDPDSVLHPDTRHPWYADAGSYLVGRLPLTAPSDDPAAAELPPPAKDGPGDPLDQPVEVKRDRAQGWGEEVSRTSVDLTPSSGDETVSDWVLPPSWPAAGQFATWENLRYEPA
jgi:hypothetical protein